MSGIPTIALDELMSANSGSVDPSRFPDEAFDLYSIPAFDNGQPELSRGREIGSAKQVVQPNDVLLSRIVPHIRRAWVVSEKRGYRQIASGEWIVFRSAKIHPSYLRYLLVEDRFHAQFMNTVAGVGGSLLRARPAQVADIEISLPPLSEQRRIAGRLEQADRLCRTRRYAIELADTFLNAVFRRLFGSRLKSGPFRAFGELVKITGGGTPARERPEFYYGRIPWLTSKDMKGDYIWDTEEHITEKAIQESATNLVPAGSILIVVKSKVLMHRLPVAIAKVPLCHGQDIKSIQCSGALQPTFGQFILKFHERRLLNLARGANTEGLTLPMLEELPVPTVSSSEQEHFATLVAQRERLRAVQREALRQAEHLFASLLNRAFSDS